MGLSFASQRRKIKGLRLKVKTLGLSQRANYGKAFELYLDLGAMANCDLRPLACCVFRLLTLDLRSIACGLLLWTLDLWSFAFGLVLGTMTLWVRVLWTITRKVTALWANAFGQTRRARPPVLGQAKTHRVLASLAKLRPGGSEPRGP